ncbi:MAG: MarR family winged helix-turn-helix transcriptional regulator [Gammaproteobacteria bacterium]
MEPIKFIDEADPSTEARAMYEFTFELQKAYAEIMAYTDAIARGLGTTGPRILTLSCIAPQPITVSDVARRMDSSRQNIQRSTDALVENGLVEYIPNPNHRRAKLAQLTDKGAEVMREWARVGGQAVQKVAGKIPEQQLLDAARTLTEVRLLVADTKP